MRIFVTAPGGYVGSAIVAELLAHGHDVFGLAASTDQAAQLTATGVEAVVGTIEQPDLLAELAAKADAVVHEAPPPVRPGIDFPTACTIETAAVVALGEAVAGSGKPFIVTSGVGLVAPGADGLVHEDGPYDPASPAYLRVPTSQAALAVQGARTCLLRTAWSVYGDGAREGFMPALLGLAARTGRSAYIGAGDNEWSTVHRRDLARLYRLALDGAPDGSTLHGVGESRLTIRTIAEAIGARLDVPVESIAPEEAGSHFGWLTPFVAHHAAASSDVTRELLGWQPQQPGLLDDLASGPLPAGVAT